MGATGANDFLRQADERGQTAGNHAMSRTDPHDAERLTGIYGSEGWGSSPSERAQAWSVIVSQGPSARSGV